MATLAKVSDVDYIQFLLAAQTAFSCVEASSTHGAQDTPPAHDAFTRLLQRQPPAMEALWQETEPLVDTASRVLVVDDSTLDKPHARHMAFGLQALERQHHRSVYGIKAVG